MGPLEIILIIIVIILLFGARKLPELAKGIGQSIKEFRKGVKESEADENMGDSTKKIDNK